MWIFFFRIWDKISQISVWQFWTEWVWKMFWHWHTESESQSLALFTRARDVRNNAMYTLRWWPTIVINEHCIVMIRNTLVPDWDLSGTFASRCSRSDPDPLLFTSSPPRRRRRIIRVCSQFPVWTLTTAAISAAQHAEAACVPISLHLLQIWDEIQVLTSVTQRKSQTVFWFLKTFPILLK